MPETPVGKVEHYYPKVKAAAVRLNKRVKVGDKVHIVGHGDDFTEKVTSMQLDHQPIQEGAPGQSIGLWVKERVHEGDDVLLVEDKPKRTAKPKAAAKPRKAPKRKAKAAKKAKKAKPRRKAAKSRKAAKRPMRKVARKAPRKKR